MSEWARRDRDIAELYGVSESAVQILRDAVSTEVEGSSMKVIDAALKRTRSDALEEAAARLESGNPLTVSDCIEIIRALKSKEPTK